MHKSGCKGTNKRAKYQINFDLFCFFERKCLRDLSQRYDFFSFFQIFYCFFVFVLSSDTPKELVPACGRCAVDSSKASFSHLPFWQSANGTLPPIKLRLAAYQVTPCRPPSYVSTASKSHFSVVKPMLWHRENYALTSWNLRFDTMKVPLFWQKPLFLCRQHVGKMYANPGNHVGKM